TAMVDPVNGSAQYTYDAVGNILSVVRRPITDLMVAQISPSRGGAGTVVTVYGTGFGSTSDTTVTFNGVPATPTAVSATQITVAVPSGAVSGPVSVTAPAGTATSLASFTVPDVIVPVISGVSPSQIDQGGTITISGSGFDSVRANNKGFIHGPSAAVSSATAPAPPRRVPRRDLRPRHGRVAEWLRGQHQRSHRAAAALSRCQYRHGRPVGDRKHGHGHDVDAGKDRNHPVRR